ncbi:MAG: cellulase family glycosylhydrolase [Herpetosiphon sp.]
MSTVHRRVMLAALSLIFLSTGALWLGVAPTAVPMPALPPADVAALEGTPNQAPALYAALNWQMDDVDSGRQLDPNQRSQLGDAYRRAWLQWNLSFLHDRPDSLASFFTGPALHAATTSVKEARRDHQELSQADASHTLRLHYFSADGTVAAFTDTAADIVRIVRNRASPLPIFTESSDVIDVVMVQVEGTWRVQNLLRISGTLVPPATSRTAVEDLVGRSGSQLSLNAKRYQSVGANYYPRDTPWDRFWPAYDSAVVDRDFALLQTLHLDSVRIFIPYIQWGGPNVDPVYLDRLQDLLRQADVYNLKVIVTLFDFRTDYNPLHWAEGDRYLQTILTRFAANPSILAWDLKNEPDLDWDAAGRDLVVGWLSHIARQARSYDSNHAITIGWSTPDHAATLAGSMTVVSFHYYAPAPDFAAAYNRLRAEVPDRPLLLTEFGVSTWNSFFFPNGHTPAEQAAYIATLLSFIRSSDCSGALVWTLHDLTYVPSSVAGRLPWRSGPQHNFGLFDASGRPKQAARLFDPGSNLAVRWPPLWTRVLKPWWLSVLMVLTVTIWIAVRLQSQKKSGPHAFAETQG